MALPLKYNVRNVFVRWRATIATVLGVALVVAVYVLVQSLAIGLEKSSSNTGSRVSCARLAAKASPRAGASNSLHVRMTRFSLITERERQRGDATAIIQSLVRTCALVGVAKIQRRTI